LCRLHSKIASKPDAPGTSQATTVNLAAGNVVAADKKMVCNFLAG
jgi:hypothetical protein